MRPGKLGSKRSKHVEQSPAKDNNVVNVEKLDYYNTCISNSCQINGTQLLDIIVACA